MEKKVCAFGLCLVLIEECTKSFGGKNVLHHAICFLSLKVKCVFCFNTGCCSDPQKDFSSRQPSIRIFY